MAADHNDSGSEREHTDQSLRVERDMADQVMREELAAIDEAADAVISRARERADRVLAAARASTDQQLTACAARTAAPGIIERERAREDQVLEDERAEADETLRDERAHHVALFSRERGETDVDLAAERARADHSVARRDEVLGVVGHDLRNMLNIISGSADLIASSVSRDDQVEHVRAAAQRIQRSATRMNRLVGDLVDVASIEAGRLAVRPELEDPAQVVKEAVDTFAAQASVTGVTLTSEIVPPPAPFAFDPARILQVLTNLLINAIKFTPPGGTVVVRAEPAGEDMRFDISDSGSGIPPEQLEAVFERFVQATAKDRRGFGLGLYISRAIIEGHGGRMWAENRSGGGSTFSFTLPMHLTT